MSTNPFEDKHASKLLSKVREDLSSLRSDVRSLLGHATRHTLPEGAREIARSGRERLASGRDYAAERVRWVGQSAREHPAGVSAAGLVLLAVAAAGVWWFVKGDCCRTTEDDG